MPKIQLSKRFVADVQCPLDKRKVDYFDIGCRGLMLEVRPPDKKVFYLRYCDHRGKQRQLKIARYGDLTLEMARKKADEYRTKIALGEDPYEQRLEARRSEEHTSELQSH